MRGDRTIRPATHRHAPARVWSRALVALAFLSAGGASAQAPAPPDYVAIPATSFLSVIESEPGTPPESIPAYSLRATPVTNAQFLAFVEAHPEWRRDRVPSVFADDRYLSHWKGALETGAEALPQQPVTRVSWFAAQAYCESEGARLPTWLEWERAASASATLEDARKDPAWRKSMLDWYSKPSNTALGSVGGDPNLFGVRDLHGLVWEWVDDFGAMMVTSDSRDQNDPDRLKFCGAAAMSLRDRDNYALLMRVAMMSSLQANDTTNNLGFRCARDGGTTP